MGFHLSESIGNKIDEVLVYFWNLPLSDEIKISKTKQILKKCQSMTQSYAFKQIKTDLLEILKDSSFTNWIEEYIKRTIECVFDTTNYNPDEDPLYWNKNEIIKELCSKKYIDIKQTEVHGYLWKQVIIKLPKIWKFKGCYFQYFLTNDSFPRQQYYSLIKEKSEMGKQVISFERLVELMEKIREYMKVRGVDMDKDKNFNTDLDNWDKMLERSDVWYFLKTKAGFGGDKFDNYYIRDSWLFDEPENNDNLYLRCRDGVFQVRKRNRNRVNLAVAKFILNLIN